MLPCQFYVLGRCNKGDSCTFSHDAAVARPGGANKLCRDFAAKGVCKNGDRCIFIHQAGSRPEPAYFYGQQPANDSSDELVGFYGEAPVEMGVHDAKRAPASSNNAKTWAKIARLPNQQSVPQEPLKIAAPSSSSTAGTKPALAQQAIKSTPTATAVETTTSQARTVAIPCKFFNSPSGCRFGDSCRFAHVVVSPQEEIEATCGICFEPLKFKKVGVLTHCDHLFCYSCVKDWRSSDMSEVERTKELVQMCPVCRVRSFFVVPSDVIPTSKELKQDIIEKYREKCSNIPCRYGDDGKCPFGTSCLFHHTIVDAAKNNLRFAKTAEGGDRALAVTVAKLGDFILK